MVPMRGWTVLISLTTVNSSGPSKFLWFATCYQRSPSTSSCTKCSWEDNTWSSGVYLIQGNFHVFVRSVEKPISQVAGIKLIFHVRPIFAWCNSHTPTIYDRPACLMRNFVSENYEFSKCLLWSDNSLNVDSKVISKMLK